jgi:hypothetical protein
MLLPFAKIPEYHSLLLLKQLILFMLLIYQYMAAINITIQYKIRKGFFFCFETSLINLVAYLINRTEFVMYVNVTSFPERLPPATATSGSYLIRCCLTSTVDTVSVNIRTAE